MKPLLILTMLAFTGACSAMDPVSDRHRDKHNNTPDKEMKKPTEPLPKGVELRKIDNELRAKLGLKDRDVLVAVTGDGGENDKTIIYITDTLTAVPGEFQPGGKLTQFTQIFTFTNSPNCNYIQGSSGWKVWYPKPHCPHPPR